MKRSFRAAHSLVRERRREGLELIKEARAGQRADYGRLKKEFPGVYAGLKARPEKVRPFLSPLWIQRTAFLEKRLCPTPSFSFLKEYSFVKAVPGWAPRMREVLESRLSPGELKGVLMEDWMGAPPDVGAPYLSSPPSMFHFYHLIRFVQETNYPIMAGRHTVVEWGGGYGGAAKLAHRWNPELTYIIVDIPLVSALQWLYLNIVLGEDRVRLCRSSADRIQAGKINLIPVHLLDGMDIEADLFLSTFALDECSRYAQRYVAGRNWFRAPRLLLAATCGSEEFWSELRGRGARVSQERFDDRSYSFSFEYAFL